MATSTRDGPNKAPSRRFRVEALRSRLWSVIRWLKTQSKDATEPAPCSSELSVARMVCTGEAIHEAGEVVALEWRDPRRLRGCSFFTVRDDRISFQRGYRGKLSFLKLHGLHLECQCGNQAKKKRQPIRTGVLP
ncbi:hypothetical protein CBM2604_B40010 [Cupriavidus taiwanensis]|nr:hypothetical protein CBM2604_B40010 [Cupriavidus taiwanensis]SOZ47910.1 hypothetical protein CBM2610_B30009 [Cupriavidus taiwanensis]